MTSHVGLCVSDVLLKLLIPNMRLYLIFELRLGLKHKCIVFESVFNCVFNIPFFLF